MAVPAHALPKALSDIGGRDSIAEAVVVSTCNRTEIYAVCETFHGAVADIHRFLADVSGLPESSFVDHLVTRFDATPEDTEVATHLFSVAAGLDSVVLGESEILGQVRTAWDAAVQQCVAGPRLSALFRHALEVGKRARAETGIARGTASVSHAAVELAADRLGGSLSGRSVLVLGAGEIGVSMVGALQHAGVAEVLVANRTRQKASALATRVGGTTVALHELPVALEQVAVLLTATSADEVVLHRDDIAAVMAAREGRPLLIVDAAMPRDVDPTAATVDGVTLLDLEAIRRFVEVGLESRRSEIDRVGAIVADEVDRYRAGSAARQVAPVITAMRSRLEELRATELSRYDTRLAGLTAEQRDAVEALTRQLMAKVAHEPTVRLKDAAGTPRGQRLADAVRALFDL